MVDEDEADPKDVLDIYKEDFLKQISSMTGEHRTGIYDSASGQKFVDDGTSEATVCFQSWRGLPHETMHLL